jgi:hypothetical protein
MDIVDSIVMAGAAAASAAAYLEASKPAHEATMATHEEKELAHV